MRRDLKKEAALQKKLAAEAAGVALLSQAYQPVVRRDLFPSNESFFVVVAAAFLTAVFMWYFTTPADPEDAVPYDVDVPAAYLESEFDALEVLENPSISIPGSTAIQCYCPANGKLLGRINPTTPDGIDRAIEKAQEAQEQYALTSFSARRRVLKTLLKHILDNSEHIARAACLDSGKTRLDAAFGEILVTAEKLQWAIAHSESVLAPSRRPVRNLLMCYKRGEVRYEPLGVTAACVSWNYPFHNALNPIVTALATGNAVVLKPSERTAHSTQYFLAIARGALAATDNPPALVAAVPCWPDAANHLTSHPGVAHVTFIGSRPVAHAVAASAARSLAPLTLELGGKDPALVLASTPRRDLPRVASILMRGVFQAAGQNCIGIERVLAAPGVHDALLALLEPRVKALRVGSALDSLARPTDASHDVDVGACISADGFARLEALVSDAVARGATLHCGGRRLTHPKYPSGHYFYPTLLSGVRSDMRIAREELFAPVMLFFHPDECTGVRHAIATANAAPFGLGASVFGAAGSADVAAAVAGLRAGMVCVNDFASFYVCSLPFGGVGGSGYGRFGGAEGLRAVCNPKAVCEDGFGGFVKTGIPGRVDYKLVKPSGRTARVEEARRWGFVSGVIALGFGLSLRERAAGLWRIMTKA